MDKEARGGYGGKVAQVRGDAKGSGEVSIGKKYVEECMNGEKSEANKRVGKLKMPSGKGGTENQYKSNKINRFQ